MNRNKFISLAGVSFLGTLLIPNQKRENGAKHNACNDPVTPSVPEGPYYKDEHLNRVDITEQKKGTPIDYFFFVEDKDCQPIQNAIVDIWQCDAGGHYSDFNKENTLNQAWLRGYQRTNKEGACKFTSIFPGWYEGRITHLHAKVHVNEETKLTTNFFFPKEIENEVYNSGLYPKGPNPISILDDFELRVDNDTTRHDALLMHVAKDISGNLTASYRITLL